MDHLAHLNSPQKEAVTTTEGPILVLAGAGSGKTRVITHRIIELIRRGVAPQNILAVTFTNKAAKEMRERVRHLIETDAVLERANRDHLPCVTTFHSLGVRILREQHERLGLRKQFTIFDRNDSTSAIKDALTRAGYDPKQYEPRRILSIISRAKGDAQTLQTFKEKARTFPEKIAATVWEHYTEILTKEHALDFDDLLLRTLVLLREHHDVRAYYQSCFHYIHIDEYQDTNAVQFEIARLIVGAQENICVVGDVDQNIYSWRGADIKNILQFERIYPRARVIMLEENYRSTQSIITASNDIIEKNINRPEKKVFTNNAEGELLSLYAAMDGTDEAEHIALSIKNLIKGGARPSDIAVLFRTNFQSRVLEEACIAFGVPYQMLGTRFFDRKEIKEVVSFLRYAYNPESVTDLVRIVNVPPRGIGKVTLLAIVEGRADTLPQGTQAKIQGFYACMERIRAYAEGNPLHQTVSFILKETGIEKHYANDGEQGMERVENMRELVTHTLRYATEDPHEALEHFLEDAALGSDQDELKDPEEHDAVRLMTIHASKGLEFPYVYISGLEEGLFPHERMGDEKTDTEEERRLFYVALTRAGKKVFLSYAHMRTIFGTSRVNEPSSFLHDIRPELIESENPTESGYERTIYLD